MYTHRVIIQTSPYFSTDYVMSLADVRKPNTRRLCRRVGITVVTPRNPTSTLQAKGLCQLGRATTRSQSTALKRRTDTTWASQSFLAIREVSFQSDSFKSSFPYISPPPLGSHPGIISSNLGFFTKMTILKLRETRFWHFYPVPMWPLYKGGIRLQVPSSAFKS